MKSWLTEMPASTFTEKLYDLAKEMSVVETLSLFWAQSVTINDELKTEPCCVPQVSTNQLFNPKKYWLKCSTANIEQNNEPVVQVSTSSVTPLKKRRHNFDDQSNTSQLLDNDLNSDYQSDKSNESDLIKPIDNHLIIPPISVPFTAYQYFPICLPHRNAFYHSSQYVAILYHMSPCITIF